MVQTITVTCTTAAEQTAAVAAMDAWAATNPGTPGIVTTANNPRRVIFTTPSTPWVVPTAP